MLFVVICPGTPEGSTGSGSGFKASQKTGQRLKVHLCFCGRVPWLYQYWPGGFMLFVVLCPGTPKGSFGSGSGFKASQKTGQWLKVSFVFLWPCSLAVPVLAGWVYAFCGSMSRNSRRLIRQWFWFQSVSEDRAMA